MTFKSLILSELNIYSVKENNQLSLIIDLNYFKLSLTSID